MELNPVMLLDCPKASISSDGWRKISSAILLMGKHSQHLTDSRVSFAC